MNFLRALKPVEVKKWEMGEAKNEMGVEGQLLCSTVKHHIKQMVDTTGNRNQQKMNKKNFYFVKSFSVV